MNHGSGAVPRRACCVLIVCRFVVSGRTRAFVLPGLTHFICRNHPALADPTKTSPVFLHGDEGAGNKKKPVLVLSISCPLVTGHSMDTKFPVVVLPSKYMTKKTWLELQEMLSKAFNKGWLKRVKGYRFAYAGTRGDWKWHVQLYPEEGVSYSSDHICFGCDASVTDEDCLRLLCASNHSTSSARVQ